VPSVSFALGGKSQLAYNLESWTILIHAPA